MRSDIWGLLGISPTGDRKAIRSAYAAQSRLHHPEEEPEYFVELNQAYKQALDFARTAGAGDADVNSREDGTGRENKGSAGNRGDIEKGRKTGTEGTEKAQGIPETETTRKTRAAVKV